MRRAVTILRGAFFLFFVSMISGCYFPYGQQHKQMMANKAAMADQRLKPSEPSATPLAFNGTFTLSSEDEPSYMKEDFFMTPEGVLLFNPAGPMSWEDGLNYCRNLEYAGYTQWKMPTAKDFKKLFSMHPVSFGFDLSVPRKLWAYHFWYTAAQPVHLAANATGQPVITEETWERSNMDISPPGEAYVLCYGIPPRRDIVGFAQLLAGADVEKVCKTKSAACAQLKAKQKNAAFNMKYLKAAAQIGTYEHLGFMHEYDRKLRLFQYTLTREGFPDAVATVKLAPEHLDDFVAYLESAITEKWAKYAISPNGKLTARAEKVKDPVAAASRVAAIGLEQSGKARLASFISRYPNAKEVPMAKERLHEIERQEALEAARRAREAERRASSAPSGGNAAYGSAWNKKAVISCGKGMFFTDSREFTLIQCRKEDSDVTCRERAENELGGQLSFFDNAGNLCRKTYGSGYRYGSLKIKW